VNDYFEYEDPKKIKTVAYRYALNQLISASDANKSDGPFYCPDTFEDLIVRKCVEKQDHFAYAGRRSNVYGDGESDLHLSCKNEICEALKKEFPKGNWAVERPIGENKKKGRPKLVPDISGRINDKPIVIEVQVSSLSLAKIIKRIKGYSSLGISILWIVPLKEDLGNEKFKPRLYEKYLHSIYYGRTYYWLKGNGSRVIPVHYDRASRMIEESNWYESDGTEVSVGGYEKKYKTVFTPNYYLNEIDIKEFFVEKRQEFIPANEKKSIPDSWIFKDKLKPWWKDKN